MEPMKRILVTGATGKVGAHFISRVLRSEDCQDLSIRALCHKRLLEPRERLEVVTGSIADREIVRKATQGVTHVLHCATCKETPEDVMDVTVKGLFWLLVWTAAMKGTLFSEPRPAFPPGFSPPR